MKREEKSKLEKKVMEGVYGQPEIKKEERDRFLGEFKERIICFLTYKEVTETESYNKISEEIKNTEADKIIISRNVDINYAQDYIKLAQKNNLKFKRVDSPDFKGDVALILASNHALNNKKGYKGK